MTNKELIMRHRSLTTTLLVSILMLASAGPAKSMATCRPASSGSSS